MKYITRIINSDPKGPNGHEGFVIAGGLARNRFFTNQSKSHGPHNLIVIGRIGRIGKRFKTFYPKNRKSHGPHNLIVEGRIGRIGKRFKTFYPKNRKSHGPHNLIVIGRIGRIGKRFKIFHPKNSKSHGSHNLIVEVLSEKLPILPILTILIFEMILSFHLSLHNQSHRQDDPGTFRVLTFWMKIVSFVGNVLPLKKNHFVT